MRFALLALFLVLAVHLSQQMAWEDEGFYPAKNDVIVGTWVGRFRREAESSSSSSEESKEAEEASGEGSGTEGEKSTESSGEAPLSRFKRDDVDGSGEAILSRVALASFGQDVAEASGNDVEGSGAFF
uniref:Secreted protein n=1 Tax=Steinernema glaseri TaxID=37863 RepID=A0A1I7Z6D9_9BILA